MTSLSYNDRSLLRYGVFIVLHGSFANKMTVVEPLSKVPQLAEGILKGQAHDRVVIDVNA